MTALQDDIHRPDPPSTESVGKSKNKPKRVWPKRLIQVIGIAALIAAVVWLTTGLIASKTVTLEKAITNAGFENVTIYPADTSKQTVASATASYGSCQLRFIIATQELSGGQGTIERLAIVESDGTLVFDATPTELSSMERYAPCTASS